jgi:hypothetical protein
MAERKPNESKACEALDLMLDIYLERLKAKTITPAELGHLTKLLRDNNIQVVGEKNSTVLSITEALPTFEDENNTNAG